MRTLATVAVHEWMHRRGYDEREAYAAGTRFASKMGDRAVAQWHETLGREVENEDQLTKLLREMGLR
jgi:hypothetical protein